MAARAFDEKFNQKSPIASPLIYALATAGASFLNNLLRQRSYQKAQHARG